MASTPSKIVGLPERSPTDIGLQSYCCMSLRSSQNQTSIEKQLAINRFKLKMVLLPVDVLNIIKSYAFEDIIIAFIKKKKIKINNIINNPNFRCDNKLGLWSIQFENFNFLGENCLLCGNYSDMDSIGEFTLKIKCLCAHNVYYDIDIYDDNYYNSVGYIGDVWSNYD